MRKLLITLTGVMLSFSSFADLGEIKVNSYLSQQLNATIPITGISEASLSELSIGLASNTKFKNNGITFNPELGSLQFKIMNLKNSPYLQITSTRVISSPVLNVLLHYKQNEDDFYRQYTLLLDPIELDDAVVAKVSNTSSKSIVKREVVLNKIAGERPIAISNNSSKMNTAPINKNLFAMDLTNPIIAKQLANFNPASMIFTTRKNDSLYAVARFEQLIYPNAQFNLNQIIVALGLENYSKLKSLAQSYESGIALALPLPQDVNLIQTKLADQYLLDSTLNSAERRQLLALIAASFDTSLKIESSELFIENRVKNSLITSNVKKPFVMNSPLPVVNNNNGFLGIFLEYKYYFIFGLFVVFGIILFLIRKKILGSRDEGNMYSAAAIASKNVHNRSINSETSKPDLKPDDFVAVDSTPDLNKIEPVYNNIEILDDLSDDTGILNESITSDNYKQIDEELMNTLESILAFDEGRDDIRYKLFELYVSASMLKAANAAYIKLDGSLDGDSPLRDSIRATCLQYEFIPPGAAVELSSDITPLILENSHDLNDLSDSQDVLIPSVIDLSTQAKTQFLNQINVQNKGEDLFELEKPIIALSHNNDNLHSKEVSLINSVEQLSNDFLSNRGLDFSAINGQNDVPEIANNMIIAESEELLTYSANKSELDDLLVVDSNNNPALSTHHDERFNLAQMYYQVEEFAKAQEILVELVNASEVSNKIKVCAQQLLAELKLNG